MRSRTKQTFPGVRWEPCPSIPLLGFDVDTNRMRVGINEGRQKTGQDLRAHIMKQAPGARWSARMVP